MTIDIPESDYEAIDEFINYIRDISNYSSNSDCKEIDDRGWDILFSESSE